MLRDFCRIDNYRAVRSSLIETVVTPLMQAGGGPAAAPFLCSPKKGSKERVGALLQPKPPPPQEVPKCAGRQSGGETNSLRSNMFPHPTDSRPIWQRLNAEHVNGNVKSRSICSESGIR